jgi:L-ribulose-5-phosphate 3-epimerase
MQTAILTKVFEERSLHDACELAADIGYDGVELIGSEAHLGPTTTRDEASALRAHLDDLDLDVPCLATYTGGYVGKDEETCLVELERLEHYCELADVLDVDLIRHNPGGPGSYAATDAQYDTAAEWFRQAATIAADYGKDLGVEIHSNTLVEATEDALRFFELVDRDNVGAIHDAANMYISHVPHGQESIEELGERLFHVHVKDERPVIGGEGRGAFELETREGLDRYEPTLLGEGNTDYETVVDSLAAVGYDGYLTDECHVPPSEHLSDRAIAEREYAELRRLIGSAPA